MKRRTFFTRLAALVGGVFAAKCVSLEGPIGTEYDERTGKYIPLGESAGPKGEPGYIYRSADHMGEVEFHHSFGVTTYRRPIHPDWATVEYSKDYLLSDETLAKARRQIVGNGINYENIY